MHNPYVGITDFVTFEQVQRMLIAFKANLGQEQGRRLHVGVMMSYKTLHDLETKWAKAFPSKETIADIFGSDETMNCLHYVDYDAIDVCKSLTEAINFGGVGINALQLDMIWPDPEHVASAIHASRKQLEVILQVGKNAIEQADNDPQKVVERLRDYEPVAQYVLLDKSMGPRSRHGCRGTHSIRSCNQGSISQSRDRCSWWSWTRKYWSCRAFVSGVSRSFDRRSRQTSSEW